jgi:hypothetical protein
MRFLCMHGVGHQEISPRWQQDWSTAIDSGLHHWSRDMATEYKFLPYDELFEQAGFDIEDVGESLLDLAVSGIWHGLGDLFGGRTRDMAARGNLDATIRWTGGMVAQWVADEDLRDQCTNRIAEYIAEFDPEVIVAHSLGSLITYDALLRDHGLARGRRLVTFGSQIGNAAVRSVFGGYLSMPDGLARWDHLYNPHDEVFTARLRIAADNLVQVDAAFDSKPPLNHDAVTYLTHPMAIDGVWQNVASTPAARALAARYDKAFASATRTPNRRALLVGINDYPNPADRLEGCVNDVFKVSATLQELGFDASDIRVVLNERATADNIKDRLHWLLDDAAKDDIRFFFYSGHGAELPGYGGKGEIDSVDECLVPYDFAWSPQTGSTNCTASCPTIPASMSRSTAAIPAA